MTKQGGVSADLIARAIVAAAISYGDDPALVLTTKRVYLRRAVTAACGGLQKQTGVPMIALAPLFKVNNTAVSACRKRAHADWVKAEEAARRAVEFAGWHPEAAVSRADANAVGRAKPAPASAVALPVGVDAAKPQGVPPAKPAAVHRSMAHGVATGAAAMPAVPKEAMRYAVKARRPALVPPAARVERLRPVTGKTVRYARRFMAAGGWEVEEVAELFSVNADDLARALGVEAAA